MKTAQSTSILQRLEGLRQKGLYRSLETFAAAGGKLPGNPEPLNFCANDYLNLAQHPQVQEQAIYAIRHYGCGSVSSRLLSGHLELHQQLEEQLAAWSGGYEAALCFGSGYLANCGILQAVLEPGALVLFDRLNHASLVDGLRLAVASQASNPLQGKHLKIGAPIEWQRYRHRDMADLERRLQAIREQQSERTIWIVSESVFSMDGDIAPLAELARLRERYGCHWLLDEAHAAGIYGPNGAGLAQSLALKQQGERLDQNQAQPGRLPDFVTANFAKALGSYGGYCLCSAEWRDYLVNFCRSFTYSTALPPSSAAAASAAIKLIQSHCSETHRSSRQNAANKNPDYPAAGLGYRLLERSAQFRSQLKQKVQGLLPGETGASKTGTSKTETSKTKNWAENVPGPAYSPIVPLILGENERALVLARRLRKHGVVVKAIRSPTVPTARLRFSLSLAHSEADLERCAEALQVCLQEQISRENPKRKF